MDTDLRPRADAETATQTKPASASKGWLSKLGPGLITGAADDDPSGIATYTQAGAQFGYGTLWTLALAYPLMIGIQAISAHIGRVSGHGLATNIRRHFPAWLLYTIVGLLLLANTINIAADIAAMGQAASLVLGGGAHWYAAAAGVLSAVLQVMLPYRSYVRVLKWLTLALLAYVATALSLKLPWLQVLHAAVLPSLSWDKDYITTVVAIFGTTISPYLFFWQASQEVEDLRADDSAQALKRAPQQAPAQFRRIKIDTVIGMGFSNLVAMFIVMTAAATLGAHGVTQITSSAQAAEALRPIAGDFAFALFSIGIIGTGLLAVPVLAGSAAYAIAGAMRWKNSLELQLSGARKFYAIIIGATLVGTALCFTSIDPMRALYWSAVVNGVIAVPVMAVVMLLATRPAVMGTLVISRRLRVLGWLCTAVMTLAALAMFATLE
ncbi:MULTISPECIES: NRAMP family divalent metal transporter [unclassified Duganella]|uniref:NRAMP family divalent metal transporter n=1 Tax=unclassified Duganella TaxID=2636909 RepID=UPI0008848638|nr:MULTISPECIES: divalent metal cation transporter [unclassified Duganella]SDF92931.1 NRAMP (natural resistance-associated macrophage protein) metal ion transporters [Duganella sp. OV458]SDJ12006.1 NRAMP (natural resistance-associated macrophage protein) metal ion transporters [Duganella sp. OV510]